MKLIAILGLAAGLLACTPNSEPREVHHRQQPTNTEPGVHVSGHVNIGVVRNF